MAKFKCVKSTSYGDCSPKVGDVIEGKLKHGRILISKDSDRKNVLGNPYWVDGENTPLKGSVWTWEEIK